MKLDLMLVRFYDVLFSSHFYFP